jgi:hypothetical protein
VNRGKIERDSPRGRRGDRKEKEGRREARGRANPIDVKKF